jgi:hypothetical protein
MEWMLEWASKVGGCPEWRFYLVFPLVLGRISSNLSQEQGFRYLFYKDLPTQLTKMSYVCTKEAAVFPLYRCPLVAKISPMKFLFFLVS